jgi:menaquinone-dependent protoporphyrinogen IX oxidase
VLIATQGSEFKDAVVSAVAGNLKNRGCYVKVVDVSALPGVREAEWNAIVVLHTWEMRKPPGVVKTFVERARNSGKLVVLTTSGAGTFRIEGIDAISSASVVADAPDRAAEISAKVDAILNRQTG